MERTSRFATSLRADEKPWRVAGSSKSTTIWAVSISFVAELLPRRALALVTAGANGCRPHIRFASFAAQHWFLRRRRQADSKVAPHTGVPASAGGW